MAYTLHTHCSIKYCTNTIINWRGMTRETCSELLHAYNPYVWHQSNSDHRRGVDLTPDQSIVSLHDMTYRLEQYLEWSYSATYTDASPLLRCRPARRPAHLSPLCILGTSSLVGSPPSLSSSTAGRPAMYLNHHHSRHRYSCTWRPAAAMGLPWRCWSSRYSYRRRQDCASAKR